MIDYKETKKAMGMRGIEFTDTQFSFILMVAIGIDKYDAYKLSIVSDKIGKIKEDKLSEFEDKCKKDCDVLLEENNIKQLIDYFKKRYKFQIREDGTTREAFVTTDTTKFSDTAYDGYSDRGSMCREGGYPVTTKVNYEE